MLDVHAPDHSIHGVRDFFIHILTITVGLLIALSLEAGVEAMHHRHQRHEAETNMRQELHDNKDDLQKFLNSSTTEEQSLSKALLFVSARAENKHITTVNFQLGLNLATLQDASWRTSTATGVVTYMDYSEVKEFAAAYRLQEQFLVLQQETLDNFLQMQTFVLGHFDPQNLPPDQARIAARDVQQAIAHLEAARQVGNALIAQYDQALKAR